LKFSPSAHLITVTSLINLRGTVDWLSGSLSQQNLVWTNKSTPDFSDKWQRTKIPLISSSIKLQNDQIALNVTPHTLSLTTVQQWHQNILPPSFFFLLGNYHHHFLTHNNNNHSSPCFTTIFNFLTHSDPFTKEERNPGIHKFKFEDSSTQTSKSHIHKNNIVTRLWSKEKNWSQISTILEVFDSKKTFKPRENKSKKKTTRKIIWFDEGLVEVFSFFSWHYNT